MSRLILLVLIIGVLYIAFTYLKGSRNTYRSSDGITTRPFGGGAAGNEDLLPEGEDEEDKFVFDETDKEPDFKADEADEVDESDVTPANSEVKIDSEVRIDAQMLPDTEAGSTPANTEK